MKLSITLKTSLALVTMFLLVATSCTAKNKKPETQTLSQEIAAEVQLDDKDETIEEQKTSEQKETTKKDSNDGRQVDPDRIYEESEVQRALSNQTNPELVDFFLKNFKDPESDSLQVDGTILADLIIEKDGSISDVIIAQDLHPLFDKEAVRVLKLMPNFMPGKINGMPVRSKYRMPVRIVPKMK